MKRTTIIGILLTIVALALAWAVTGCGTTGGGSVTLGPGDTVTIAGSWTMPAGARALVPARQIPVLPGTYSTNAAGTVKIVLTNAVALR
jgi:hypothetical protein